MSDHKFFKNFGYKHEKPKVYMTQEMNNNLFIMEICNNWDYVKNLMKLYKEGKLKDKRIDQMDHGWITNLSQNNINLDEFNDSEDFYKKYIV